MKVIKPSKVFLGHIYIEYIGNNMIFLNSDDDRIFENVHLFEYISLKDGIRANCSFKIVLLGLKYIVGFKDMTIYKFDTVTNKYFEDDWSFLVEYETFTNRNIFMVTGKLTIYNKISESDGRNETFSFKLIFDNKEEINNLFKH
ncbi:hypothetical protein [Xanthomarina gelatinilytica]|uniref:hypothetical protein n=1 Tax=Xanthomarina gelatinilytica TaxID=1137281 RepID=UPI00058DE429|nr:hypothetical protein [Xanthomarina gelatinilytica]